MNFGTKLPSGALETYSMDLTEPHHTLQTVLKNKRLPQGEALVLGSYPRGCDAKINKISTMQDSSSHIRVIAYIDGFNLFYGLKSSNMSQCKWLDLQKLIAALLIEHQVLVAVKYFTSPVKNDSSKQMRQSTYLSALEHSGVTVVYGHFKTISATCAACSHRWNETKEKMTDVNIATEMITDAFQNQFDLALLISGDSDLVPPIRAIRRYFTTKKVLAVFPPERHSNELKETANASLNLRRKTIQNAQFPSRIILANGYVLKAPEGWT